MKETRLIQIDVYRCNNNEPTCALDFSTGDVCIFYRSQGLKQHQTCVFAPEWSRGYNKPLRRREDKGYLVPGDWCPIWNKDKLQDNI
jgi:hypothetical protein